jgi:hypothetical protein
MFADLDTQEIINLAHALISANSAIVKAHGAGSDLNKELCDIFDDVESAADVYGIVL